MTSYTDMMQMCRLCLVKDQVNLPIFGGQGDIQQIFLKITACLPVKVSRDDNLPKNICDGCSYKLDMLYQFWNTSSNSEKQLIDWLQAAGVDPKHKSNEPIGLVASQPNVILKQEPVTELDAISSDTQNYIIQQQQLAYKPEEYDEQALAKSTKKKAAEDSADDESSSKRPRRATRNTISVTEVEDDSEDDYMDTDTGIAKTEDETEEDEDEDDDLEGDEGDDMADPDFVAVEEDAEQPGPSGVGGAKTTTGPSSLLDYASYKKQYGLKECVVFLGNASDFDHKQYQFMRTQAYCEVAQTNIISASRLKYKCEHCTAKFRDRFRLEMHMEDAHSDVEVASVNSISSEEVYVPEPDEDDEDYEDGEAPVVDIKPDIMQTENLDKSKDSEGDNEDEKGESLVCSKCFKVFKRKRFLAKHLKNVHNVFACMLCTQLFYSKGNFERHTQTVHNDAFGKWRCKMCSISFSEYYHLIEHNFEKHKPTCHLCNKDFPDLQSLVQHKVLRHSVPENIICKECGLTTNDENSLRDHMRLHKSPCFNCELCDASMKTQQLYIDHVKTNHVGKEPSPRILNLSQKLPSIKMTFTKDQSHVGGGQKGASYVVSQPPQPSTSGTSAAVPTGSNNQLKVAIPQVGAQQSSVQNPVMSPQAIQAGNKDQTKFLVVDKSTNKAYLIPAFMVNQNGQMRLAISENATGEPVVLNDSALSSAQLSNFNVVQTTSATGQPRITNIMQPTMSTMGQPRMTNIMQPAMSGVVRPSTSLVQPTMAPAFVMNTVQNTTTTMQNNVTLRIANNMPNVANPGPPPLTSIARPSKKVAIPRLPPKPTVKQYRPKKSVPNYLIQPNIQIVADNVVNLQCNFVLSNVRTEATNDDGDISEMPQLEVQSIQNTSTSSVATIQSINETCAMTEATVEQVEECIPPPTLIPEVADTTAHRPKIFLKPLSQLLEKSKVNESVDVEAQPGTSQNKLIKVTPDRVPAHIKKVIAKPKTNVTPTVVSENVQNKINNFQNKDKSIYKCNVCGITFKRLTKLQQHQTKMKCKLCSYTGCRLKALDVHYKVIHDFQNQCVTCDIKFDTSEKLKDHNKQAHLCVKCNKLYPSMPKHTSTNVCIKCNEFLCTPKELTDHYQTEHQINHFCPPCKNIFDDEQSLNAHKKQVHFCDKCQSYKMDLTMHDKFCKGDSNYSETSS